MIKPNHLLTEVIDPVLSVLGKVNYKLMAGPTTQLMLGTAAQESDLGFYLRQWPSGPARGLWQMEEATVRDIVDRYLQRQENAVLRHAVLSFWSGNYDIAEEISWNMALACALARVRYWMVPIPIPEDLEDQARYWDIHYNANEEDEVEEYIASYNEFVLSNFQ